MNALIEQLTALKLHGMVQAAPELLASKQPPNWIVGLQHLIDAEATERDVIDVLRQSMEPPTHLIY
jgi:hypothetical protein